MRAPVSPIVLLAVTVTLSAEFASAQVIERDSLALVALYNATDGPNWHRDSPGDLAPWLVGPVSSWHSVRVAGSRVTYLYTERVRMKGEIPSEIGELDGLTFLALSYDQRTGSIPPEIGEMTTLEELDLFDNQFRGELSVEIGSLLNLRHLDVQDNPALGGPLPLVLMNLPNLRTVKVTNTSICAPANTAFIQWLNSIGEFGPHSCAVASADGFDRRAKYSVSFGTGLISSSRAPRRDPGSGLYADIQFRKRLFSLIDGTYAIAAGAYAGGWKTTDSRPYSGAPDYAYSQQGIILGARVFPILTRSVFPISIFAGISRHFVWADWKIEYVAVEPGAPDGNVVGKSREAYNSLEVGFRVNFPIGKSLFVGGGAQVY